MWIIATMINAYLLFLFLLTSISVCAGGNNYHITNLHDHAGLYYNNLGQVKLSNSKFILFTHLNVTAYERKIKFLSGILKKSFDLCYSNEILESENFLCKDTIKVVQSRFNNLLGKSEVVSEIIGTSTKKTKRGIFDGASYAFNWLFGMPDADDAKFYDKSIKTLIQSNRNTQLLMKQQIGIISSTISNFNSSIRNFKSNQDTLNSNIKIFNSFSADTNKRIHVNKLKLIINSHIALLTQILDDLNEEYDLLISAITMARHNILHPKVITPKQLLNVLSEIKLNNGLQLPFPISYSTIYKYFEISKLKVFHSDNVIIFAIEIPLTDEMIYNLFKLLPLPTPHNFSDIYSYILPDFPYLLISISKVSYVRMKDLTKCTGITEEEFICQNTQATRIQEPPKCEIALFTSFSTKIPADCHTVTSKADFEIWHPLSDNSWLFVLSTPLQLTLACDNFPIEDIKIASTGLLSLEPKCRGYTQNIILESSGIITRNISKQISNINIALDDCCYGKEVRFNNTPITLQPIRLSNIKLDDLQVANHKLGQLDQLLDEELKKPFIIQHSHWFIIIISFIASVVLLVLMYNFLKWCGLISCFKSIFCCTKAPKQISDSCCIKLFNTNINTTPGTSQNIPRILEEEARTKMGEGIELNNLLSSNEATTSTTNSMRRSITPRPSIKMS